MSPRHVIVGSVALDWIFDSHGEVKRMVCGGNSLYAAAGARLWSDSVAVVARVGTGYPATYLEDFQQAGIDLSGVKFVDIPHDILSGYRYDPSGERELFSMPEEFNRLGLTPQSDSEAFFYGLDWLNLDNPELNAMPQDVPSFYWRASSFCINASSCDAQIQFMRTLQQADIPYALDPGWTLDATNRHLLQDVLVYLPSRAECGDFADALIGTRSKPWLVSLGPKIIGVKLGAAGSIVYDLVTGMKHHVPIYPSAAVDPTGAGDAYVGAFSLSMAQHDDVLESALRATVSSSFIVEHFDARHCLAIDRSEAHRRLESLRDKVISLSLYESKEMNE